MSMPPPSTVPPSLVTAIEPYKLLEQSLSVWSNREHVVSCSSGTAALHLALESLNLPQGMGVVVPNYTMVACARAVEMAGLTPIFCDVTDSMLLDLDNVDHVCSRNDGIVAVMPVHLYGRRFPMEAMDMLRCKYGLYVVEDLAEAHGIDPHWSADASCWSFYRNKIVAGEEGGAVAFKVGSIADRARSLRSLGFTEAHDYTHIPRGCNYRMSNVHAGIIMESLSHIEVNLARRKEIEAIYDKLIPYQWHNVKAGPRDVVWVYDIRVPGMKKVTQDLLVRNLKQEGIQARHGFKPMSTQEEFRGLCRQQRKKFHRGNKGKENSENEMANEMWYKGGVSTSDRLATEVIYLPVDPDRTTAKEIFKASEVIHHTLTRV